MQQAQQDKYSHYRYYTLTLAVIISGVSQGMLLSLLAVILEKQGVPSSWNSFNAISLYVGVLLASPFLEFPLRRLGYRPMMIVAILMVTLGTFLFPVWDHLWFWMLLRFIVGIGDSMIHFATQTWIMSTSQSQDRGRKISFYGFAYGLGFGIGPLGINLLSIHFWAPFIALTLFYLFVLGMVLRLENEFPPAVTLQENQRENKNRRLDSLTRYKKVFHLSWFALLPPLLFGYLESSLNNNFPVYALREGITQEWVSIILPSFTIGSLILQIPLGILSDRIGRKKVLVIVCALGGMLFLFVPFLTQVKIGLILLFLFAGALVGSTFSLGIAYAADLLPTSLIPIANILASILYGVGSMIGTYMNGLIIQFVAGDYIFYGLAFSYLITSLLGAIFKGMKKEKNATVVLDRG
jgi:MFS family permease